MELRWKKTDSYLLVLDGTTQKKIRCWSNVRNELNKLRPINGKQDVCYSINADGSKGLPIMPRPFPVGDWKITGFKEHPDKMNDGYLYPVFVATNAVNRVPEWALDASGFYARATGRFVFDYFNGLHFSTSDYTQGCIRIATESDVRWLWKNVPTGTKFTVTD